MSLARRLIRYGSVSVVCTSVSLTILGIGVWSRAMTATWANMTATAIGTIPSFELNRRWVWEKQGRRSMAAEIGPFCALSLTGFVLSTLAVRSVTGWATGARLGTAARIVAVEAANVATFGTLWVAQFVILDRMLFRPAPARA